jgi:hypothetical protein
MLALIPVIGPMLSIMTVTGWEAIKFASYIFAPGLITAPLMWWLSLGVYAVAF